MVGASLCSLTLFAIHSGFDHCVLPTLSFFLVLKTKKPRLSFVWLVVSMRRLQQLPVLTLASLPGVILVAAWLRSGSAPKRSPCNGLTVKTPTCSVMPCSASPSSWYKTGRYVYTLESPPCDRVCVSVCVKSSAFKKETSQLWACPMRFVVIVHVCRSVNSPSFIIQSYISTVGATDRTKLTCGGQDGKGNT